MSKTTKLRTSIPGEVLREKIFDPASLQRPWFNTCWSVRQFQLHNAREQMRVAQHKPADYVS